MIKFFRRIRQQLLTQNKISKYLLYAVGEIVLVIIGILIALQINNANELRKNKAKFTDLLQEVLEETIENINQTDSIKHHYDEKAVLIDRVLNNDVTFDDYESNYDFFFLINQADFQILDTAYENLIKVSDEAPIEYKELINKLKQLYSYRKKLIDKATVEVENSVVKYRDYFNVNNKWNYVANLAGLKPNRKIINYYLNDSIYKNFVWDYKISCMQGLVKSSVVFQVEAIELLNNFNGNLVDKNSKQMIKQKYYSYKKEAYKLLGVYKGAWYGTEDIIKVFEDNGVVYMSYGRNKMPVKFYSQNEFFNYEDSYLYQIRRDEDGRITGVVYPDGTIEGSVYKKVE